MANFPIPDVGYASRIDLEYPILPFGKTVYALIDGVIMAVRFVAFCRSGDGVINSYSRIIFDAANGKRYEEKYPMREFFLTTDAAREYLNNAKGYIDPFKKVSLIDYFYHQGFTVSISTFRMFYWGSDGKSHETPGDYIFWFDVDGPHHIVKKQSDGRILYKSREACVNDHFRVVDFEDEIPQAKGEYTISREFTVRAESQEEAESIIDEAINKAYKEQFE